MRHKTLSTLGILALLAPLAPAALAAGPSGPDDVRRVKEEIRATLGEVPEYLEAFPESALPGAWAEMKALQMSPETALPAKTKDLIGLAVAAQVPCDYCVYFHTEAARAKGATEREIREAIALAALIRKWSTVVNGSQIDFEDFRAETDRMLEHVGRQSDPR